MYCNTTEGPPLADANETVRSTVRAFQFDHILLMHTMTMRNRSDHPPADQPGIRKDWTEITSHKYIRVRTTLANICSFYCRVWGAEGISTMEQALPVEYVPFDETVELTGSGNLLLTPLQALKCSSFRRCLRNVCGAVPLMGQVWMNGIINMDHFHCWRVFGLLQNSI